MSRHPDFFDRPKETVTTSLGKLELPVRYHDLSAVLAFFPVARERAEAVLQNAPLVPVRFMGGRALVAVTLFDYRDTSVGPYRECGVSIATIPRGSRQPTLPLLQVIRAPHRGVLGFQVIDLPVTSDAADVGGREVWGLPKFKTEIDWNLEGVRFSGAVLAPDGNRRILTLEGSLGHTLITPMTDLVIYSLRGGELLHTRASGKGAMHTGRGRGLVLRVGDSDHPMAERLRVLGLDGAHPMFAQAGPQLQLVLPAGRPIGIPPPALEGPERPRRAARRPGRFEEQRPRA
jgi:hypothetical protein